MNGAAYLSPAMITRLHIENFALIEHLDIDFDAGLSIITGQTGAGKSILIGALNMVLGERADTNLVRQGARKAVAEAELLVGEHKGVHHFCIENEIEPSTQLILRREIRDSGSRAFINDMPVPIQALKKLGDLLVDLHGQHDHQLLLQEGAHIHLVDGFASVEAVRAPYRETYAQWRAVQRKLASTRKKQKELEEKLSLYRFQKKELNDFGITGLDEEALRLEMRRLDSAEELDEQVAQVLDLGQESEANVLDLLRRLEGLVTDMSKLEPNFNSYSEEVKTAKISIAEMLSFAEQYRNQIEFNPRRLQKIRTQLSELRQLERKYTKTADELRSYLSLLDEELNQADRYSDIIEELENQEAEWKQQLVQAATQLHHERAKVADSLEREVVELLGSLGIAHSRFVVERTWRGGKDFEIEGVMVQADESGVDEMCFLISTNKGEEPRPLAKIASGGEISRVMLALKSILAREQALPVMIFDEIDTGISGEISEKVGRAMRELSQHCQILSITHQAQIACQADHHYRVVKSEKGNRTVSTILKLTEDEHVEQVARLLSGAQVSEAARLGAKEMIETARS